MEWIKLWTRKWLWGSGRNMTADKRGVWVDLLSLAAEAKMRDGTLRFDIDKPMPRQWIANTLMLDPHMLDVCLAAFQADINVDDGQPRIKIWKDGTIEITNWERFQGKPEKEEAKKASIERAKRTRQSKDNAVIALTRQINELNKQLAKAGKKQEWVERDGGLELVNTVTGEIIERRPKGVADV